MKLTKVEHMFLQDLVRQQNEAVAPINAKMREVVKEVAERLGFDPDTISVNPSTGEVTVPAQEEMVDVTPDGADYDGDI